MKRMPYMDFEMVACLVVSLCLVCSLSLSITPQVQVSWNDAQAFCAWKYPLHTSGSGSGSSGGRGRLPTEAEWELAARGGGQYLNIEMESFQARGDMAAATAAEKAKYAKYPWGESLLVNETTHMTNIFQVLG